MHVNIEVAAACMENIPQAMARGSRGAGRVCGPSAGRLAGGMPRKVLAGGNPDIAIQKSVMRGVRTDS